MKLTVTGRPSKVIKRERMYITVLTGVPNRGLLRNMPRPKDETTVLVYMDSKQYKQAQRHIKKGARLSVTGYPMVHQIDDRHVFALFGQSIQVQRPTRR
jgi:hypothetical protein